MEASGDVYLGQSRSRGRVTDGLLRTHPCSGCPADTSPARRVLPPGQGALCVSVMEKQEFVPQARGRRMDWQGWSETLKEALGLEGSPVAATYVLEAPAGVSSRKHWVCEAWRKARDGEIIDLTAETSTCPGGTWHLGLGRSPAGKARRPSRSSWSRARSSSVPWPCFIGPLLSRPRRPQGWPNTSSSVRWGRPSSSPTYFSSS